MTRCEGLGGNRPTVRLQRHLHDRGDSEESFPWEYSHQEKRRPIKIVSLKAENPSRAPRLSNRARDPNLSIEGTPCFNTVERRSAFKGCSNKKARALR